MKRRINMKKLIEILEELQPEVDYETTENLIDGRYLDSLTILALVSEIEEEFDVEIPTVEIIPANFNSAKKIWELIERLKEE
jgi:acyl carrier protein